MAMCRVQLRPANGPGQPRVAAGDWRDEVCSDETQRPQAFGRGRSVSRHRSRTARSRAKATGSQNQHRTGRREGARSGSGNSPSDRARSRRPRSYPSARGPLSIPGNVSDGYRRSLRPSALRRRVCIRRPHVPFRVGTPCYASVSPLMRIVISVELR